MLPVSSLWQLPMGFAIGLVSALFPGLLRPVVVVRVLLLAIEGVLLYRAGGTAALAPALEWLVKLVRSATLAVVGLGLGLGR